MARLPRIDVPGLPQHLIVRGNNRANLFADDADRWLFMRFLKEAVKESGCELHAYVLMSNHVHLLATGEEHGALSMMMQSVGRRFSRFFNVRHDRTGGLFEGRFRSSLVQSERYLLTCMRYIEANPLRAGMVHLPADYRWSSHRQNATGNPTGMLTAHEVFLRLGGDPLARATAYRALFIKEIPAADLEAIRASASRGRVLGSEEFRKRLAAQLGRSVGIPPPGRPKGDRLKGNLTPA